MVQNNFFARAAQNLFYSTKSLFFTTADFSLNNWENLNEGQSFVSKTEHVLINFNFV